MQELIDLIKEDPYTISLALEDAIDSLGSALHLYPDDSDAKEWDKHIIYLEKIRAEIDKLWRK